MLNVKDSSCSLPKLYTLKLKTFITISFILLYTATQAQLDTSLSNKAIYASKFLSTINGKLSKFNNKLTRRTNKTLEKFHKAELKLINKMFAKDSLLAKAHLVEANRKYDELKNGTTQTAIGAMDGEYNTYIDSVKTFLSLVDKNKNAFPDLTSKQLDNAKKYVADAQAKLKYSDDIKKYLSTQKGLLRNAAKQLNIVTKFKQLEKAAYYYNEYVKEYQMVLKDKKKIEKRLMGLLMNNNKVKDFFAKNSMLASLFHIPDGNGVDMSNMPVLAGIQTRANINALIQQRASSGGPNAATAIKAQIQNAKSELDKFKTKLQQYGTTTDADGQPLGFTPNQQKTKPFIKKLEYGANIQSSKGSNGFPAISDLAVSLGYKVNDKSVFSIGGSYKLGLGQGWDKIKLSSQGISLRSSLDWKLKGSFFVAGSYELNHFYNVNETALYQNGYWEKAALFGLTKKYKINKKLKGNMQLLYNFLTNKQPIVFRVGYTFK
jgi:hypothetical protein